MASEASPIDRILIDSFISHGKYTPHQIGKGDILLDVYRDFVSDIKKPDVSSFAEKISRKRKFPEERRGSRFAIPSNLEKLVILSVKQHMDIFKNLQMNTVQRCRFALCLDSICSGFSSRDTAEFVQRRVQTDSLVKAVRNAAKLYIEEQDAKKAQQESYTYVNSLNPGEAETFFKLVDKLRNAISSPSDVSADEWINLLEETYPALQRRLNRLKKVKNDYQKVAYSRTFPECKFIFDITHDLDSKLTSLFEHYGEIDLKFLSLSSFAETTYLSKTEALFRSVFERYTKKVKIEDSFPEDLLKSINEILSYSDFFKRLFEIFGKVPKKIPPSYKKLKNMGKILFTEREIKNVFVLYSNRITALEKLFVDEVSFDNINFIKETEKEIGKATELKKKKIVGKKFLKDLLDDMMQKYSALITAIGDSTDRGLSLIEKSIHDPVLGGIDIGKDIGLIEAVLKEWSNCAELYKEFSGIGQDKTVQKRTALTEKINKWNAKIEDLNGQKIVIYESKNLIKRIFEILPVVNDLSFDKRLKCTERLVDAFKSQSYLKERLTILRKKEQSYSKKALANFGNMVNRFDSCIINTFGRFIENLEEIVKSDLENPKDIPQAVDAAKKRKKILKEVLDSYNQFSVLGKVSQEKISETESQITACRNATEQLKEKQAVLADLAKDMKVIDNFHKKLEEYIPNDSPDICISTAKKIPGLGNNYAIWEKDFHLNNFVAGYNSSLAELKKLLKNKKNGVAEFFKSSVLDNPPGLTGNALEKDMEMLWNFISELEKSEQTLTSIDMDAAPYTEAIAERKNTYKELSSLADVKKDIVSLYKKARKHSSNLGEITFYDAWSELSKTKEFLPEIRSFGEYSENSYLKQVFGTAKKDVSDLENILNSKLLGFHEEAKRFLKKGVEPSYVLDDDESLYKNLLGEKMKLKNKLEELESLEINVDEEKRKLDELISSTQSTISDFERYKTIEEELQSGLDKLGELDKSFNNSSSIQLIKEIHATLEVFSDSWYATASKNTGNAYLEDISKNSVECYDTLKTKFREYVQKEKDAIIKKLISIESEIGDELFQEMSPEEAERFYKLKEDTASAATLVIRLEDFSDIEDISDIIDFKDKIEMVDALRVKRADEAGNSARQKLRDICSILSESADTEPWAELMNYKTETGRIVKALIAINRNDAELGKQTNDLLDITIECRTYGVQLDSLLKDCTGYAFHPNLESAAKMSEYLLAIRSEADKLKEVNEAYSKNPAAQANLKKVEEISIAITRRAKEAIVYFENYLNEIEKVLTPHSLNVGEYISEVTAKQAELDAVKETVEPYRQFVSVNGTGKKIIDLRHQTEGLLYILEKFAKIKEELKSNKRQLFSYDIDTYLAKFDKIGKDRHFKFLQQFYSFVSEARELSHKHANSEYPDLREVSREFYGRANYLYANFAKTWKTKTQVVDNEITQVNSELKQLKVLPEEEGWYRRWRIRGKNRDTEKTRQKLVARAQNLIEQRKRLTALLG